MESRERTTETERRRATTLFCDITGFTELNQKLDEEDAYALVSECLLLLDGIARKYGGNIDKYFGDAIMAVYGSPFAIENAARSAVNAAIEMHNRTLEFSRERNLPEPLDVHTGINTGTVISGDISGPITREFSVMGHSVNVAARLKDRAPRGQIWVGAATYRATKDDFEFRPLEPMAFKGVLEPMPVYEVLSRTPLLHRPKVGRISSPFVGRRQEMARLCECVERAAAGEGGIATVVGEAGAGKSRVIAELAASKGASRVSWFEARSISVGSQLSFHPFVDLLRSWVGIGDGDDGEAGLAPLEAAASNLFGDEASEVVPFLARMMGPTLREEHRQRLAGLEGEALEKLIVRTMILLLRRLAEKEPLVLVFEDIHWSDGSSLDLLESLLRLTRDQRILFVLTARPGFPETAQRVLTGVREHYAATHVEIELEPLDPQSTGQLIENIFGDGDVPHATRRLIEEKTSGNPFFIEEVIRSLLDDEAIEWRDGGLWATDRLGDVVIPGSVQEVVMARIDRLDLPTKHVLQIGSVIGRRIDYRLIEPIVEASLLDAALEQLVDLQLLVRRDRRVGSELLIRHPLIQEVAYETMLKAKRRELHRKVAEAVLAVLPSSAAGRAGMLAYHYSSSDEPALAEEYLFQAGDEAARIAASSEALHFFQEASKLYFAAHGEGGDPAKKAMLEKKIALASYHRGQFIEAVAHFDRALGFLGAPKPRGRPAAVYRFVRTLLAVLMDLYGPRRSKPRPAASDREREIIEVVFDRARSQTTAAPAEFLFDSMEGLGKLRRVNPTTVNEAGGMYAGTAFFSFAGLSFGLTERFLAIARDLVNEDDTKEVVLVQMMQFMHKLLMGDWATVWEISEEAITEALRLGRLWDVTAYLGLEADKRVYQGRFREAGERIEQIGKIEDLYAYDLARSNRQLVTLILLRERRKLDDALEAADAYIAENDEPALHLLGLGMKAEIQILLEDFESAQRSLARAREIAAEAGRLPPLQVTPYLRARFLMDLVELEAGARGPGRAGVGTLRMRAGRSGRKAVRAAKMVAWEQPPVHRLMGTRYWLLGKRNAAFRWWKSSLDCAERLDMRPELGRTYLEIGRRLSAAPEAGDGSGGVGGGFDGLTAAECLDRARTILRELGLEVEVAAPRPETTA